MEDDGKFGENPFRNLDLGIFPNARPTPAGPSAKVAGRHSVKAEAPEISEEDRALFARAMERLREHAKKPQSPGFLLSTICPLPDCGKSKMERKKSKRREAFSKNEDTRTKPAEDAANEFLLAMRDATPLGKSGRQIARPPAAVPARPLHEPGMEEFMAGDMAFTLSHTDEYMAGHVAGLDELTINQLAMGQYSPEAHIDLHGLNSAQAFQTLRDFIRSCWFKGLRVALIVTGRGRNSPDGHAVLRQKLQLWLTQEPFKRVVLAFCTAQAHDGGPGAIYVLFRKYRKKGRIYWERMPADADLY